ncbi:dihydropteroate synthase [Lutibacter sp. A64]|uniref:dihydropteroate synthase n=1 Tax=Lutibacter sp. A64 TaxID=2918526 RepID=UPI001F067C4E|nr:dihydropteroate synthase [Lutibacter sp. A64]UMB53660.1 dihydropteroate synthase [Lutibacter sp. A64]
MQSINCKGTLVDLTSPKVMGILNITPDSFFDGGNYKNEAAIISQVKKMLTEGATFIDIGAYSSRPGAKHISEKEELERILPVVKLLVKEFPEILISIDTFRSNIAQQCIENGACIINDISAGSMDTAMFKSIAKLQVPYIIMHMQGTPQNMQTNPTYKNVITDILYYFSEKIYELRALAVNDIIADVGFGFGKTIGQNYWLLKNLEIFKSLEIPTLTGISRKSMLYKPLDITAKTALNATTAANTIALLNGTNILRVHDVKEAVETIKIVNLLKN